MENYILNHYSTAIVRFVQHRPGPWHRQLCYLKVLLRRKYTFFNLTGYEK